MFAAKKILINDDLKSTIKYLADSISKLLQHANPHSVLVFDGGCLPSKDNTMHVRKQARLENLRLANEAIDSGENAF